MSEVRWKAVRPLRHRDYRLLWTGLAVALLGSGLWLVALAWQVIELGGGPVQLSVVTTAYSIGLVVCVLFGGIAADRLPQRTVIVTADVVRGVVLLVVAGLALGGLLEIWHLAAGAVIIGAGEAFLIPAYTALVPRLLPPDELLAANGLEGTLRPLAQQATGPVIGGLVIAAISPGVAILVAGLTYLFSAACVLAMNLRHEPAGPAQPDDDAEAAPSGIRAMGRDLVEGWSYVRRTRWLLASLLFGTVFVLLILGPLEVLLPFAIRDQLGGDAREFGLVMAAFGIGGAVGALLISSRKLPRRYLTVMTLMWGLGSVPFVVLGFAEDLWLMAAGAAIVGATGSAAMVIWGTLLQRRVPDHLRGRIASLDFFVSLLLMPVSMALAGPAGSLFGVTAVFVVAGVGPALVSFLVIWFGRMRSDELANPLDQEDGAENLITADA
ncbi:major facilitator superfamily MFS_1 [Kribbella flavida DSM 17836]|uniref:Major facilitator superfamily MFS_1 n=1 Tax=Kribbella flavida (strain DSM 17836 / JCM 10339 / NBRC 14399) TaxID=479435 RepID=D2Q003_KRIFD|nr:MFS transporter [Kribbella flavida]ADB30001.1 major facilitator superfamily MFS_1 [Kribbella flavida DSM 17836]